MEPPDSPSHVPYQAYKSKRHSRNLSNPNLTPNVSPPHPRPRPSLSSNNTGTSTSTTSTTGSGAVSPPLQQPVFLQVVDNEVQKQHGEFVVADGVNGVGIRISNGSTEADTDEAVEAMTVTMSMTSETSSSSSSSEPTTSGPDLDASTNASVTDMSTRLGDEDSSIPKIMVDSIASTTTPPPPTPPKANGKAVDNSDSTPSAVGAESTAAHARTRPTTSMTISPPTSPTRASSSTTSSPEIRPTALLSNASRKPSTFRRITPVRPGIPPNVSSRSTPMAPSPLRPPGAGPAGPGHSRTVSNSSISIQRQLDVQPPPQIQASSSTSSSSSQLQQPLAVAPVPLVPPPRTTSLAASITSPPVISPASSTQHSTSTSSSSTHSQYPSPVASPSPTTPLPAPTPQNQQQQQRQQLSPPPPPPTPRSVNATPYRPGFQPKGVYRPLTDEFLELRRAKRDVGRIEKTKLERRLEKLIALHFPVDGLSNSDSGGGTKDGQRPALGSAFGGRRSSSFFDLDFEGLKDPAGLWRSMLSQGGDVRAAEQRITPWQDDAEVSKCPFCVASFHPITNRKHHCRLCGRIICSLPIKNPQRPSPCSFLFVVDPHTRRIEEVKEGVDYGVRRRRTTSTTGSLMNGNAAKEKTMGEEEQDKFLKGVRVCRGCRPVIMRRQFLQEFTQVPTFAKLYETFIALETEIEDSLPQFQELVMSLSNDDQPTKAASAARKRLLESFAQYDALSKRIRKLPLPGGGGGQGSSQDRVQLAIMTRANLFLQKNMFPLQSLPTKSKQATPAPLPSKEEITQVSLIDPDSEVAKQLQPLLEQEALLESFVEEATSHRKFEDAKTLKTNLKEIRAEIERVVRSADVGVVESKGESKGHGGGGGQKGRRKARV